MTKMFLLFELNSLIGYLFVLQNEFLSESQN